MMGVKQQFVKLKVFLALPFGRLLPQTPAFFNLLARGCSPQRLALKGEGTTGRAAVEQRENKGFRKIRIRASLARRLAQWFLLPGDGSATGG